jgi:hypothetical protein
VTRTEAQTLKQTRCKTATWQLQAQLMNNPDSTRDLALLLNDNLDTLMCHPNSLFVFRALLSRNVKHPQEAETEALVEKAGRFLFAERKDENDKKYLVVNPQTLGPMALGDTCTGSHKNVLWFMKFLVYHRRLGSLRMLCEFALDSDFTDELLSNHGNLLCQRAVLCVNYFIQKPAFGSLLDKAILLAEDKLLGATTLWKDTHNPHCAGHFMVGCFCIAQRQKEWWEGFVGRCQKEPDKLRQVCAHKTGDKSVAFIGIINKMPVMELES